MSTVSNRLSVVVVPFGCSVIELSLHGRFASDDDEQPALRAQHLDEVLVELGTDAVTAIASNCARYDKAQRVGPFELDVANAAGRDLGLARSSTKSGKMSTLVTRFASRARHAVR